MGSLRNYGLEKAVPDCLVCPITAYSCEITTSRKACMVYKLQFFTNMSVYRFPQTTGRNSCSIVSGDISNTHGGQGQCIHPHYHLAVRVVAASV